MNDLTIRRYFSILFPLAAMPALRASDAVVTNAMVGQWKGSAHVIVTWCNQAELPILLEIRADDNVTGKVGDAELTDSHLTKKWSWLGQNDGRRTTRIIRGSLKGPIVAKEEISRREISIHLRFGDTRSSGGLATSGSKFGGKETMILTATSLQLAKQW